MKIQSILRITKIWLALVLVLALLAWVEIARADATLDEKFVRAAKTRDVALVKSLLEKGANVNAKDGDGTPALMLAARKQNKDVVRLLLEKGADVNAKDKEGRTALELADWAGHYDIVEILGGKRADRDMTGYPDTPEEVVKAYVKAGFDVASVRQLSGSHEVKEQKRYVLDYFCPGWDCVHLALDYNVVGTHEDVNESRVTVVYEDIGAVCTETLQLRKKSEQEAVYQLKKVSGKFWLLYTRRVSP
jgi:ankyrin repeat protein